MPAVRFSVKWPDGDKAIYYSPSTIIHEYFKEPGAIPMEQFLATVHSALDAASERVFQRYGYYCSSAADEQEKILRKAKNLKASNIDGDIFYAYV